MDVEKYVDSERQRLRRRAEYLKAHPQDVWLYKREKSTVKVAFERELQRSVEPLAPAGADGLAVLRVLRAEFWPVFQQIPFPVEIPQDYYDLWTEYDAEGEDDD